MVEKLRTNDIIQDLRNNPKYDFLTDKRYVAILQNFVAAYDKILNDQASQYNDQKVQNDLNQAIQSTTDELSKFKQVYINEQHTRMALIENSYQTFRATKYNDPAQEMLRRQDLQATLELMDKDAFKVFADNTLSNPDTVNPFDLKVIIDLMTEHGMKVDRKTAIWQHQNAYKNDVNYIVAGKRLAQLEFINVTDNSHFGLMVVNGKANLDSTDIWLFPTEQTLATAATVGATKPVTDLLKQLKSGVDALANISADKKQTDDDITSVDLNSLAQIYSKQQAPKVADNDPRINQTNSHYSVDAEIQFLSERFNSELNNNPIYTDPTAAGYDLTGKLTKLRGIYHAKLTNGTYKPINVVDTKDIDPNTMNDEQIISYFGKLA